MVIDLCSKPVLSAVASWESGGNKSLARDSVVKLRTSSSSSYLDVILMSGYIYTHHTAVFSIFNEKAFFKIGLSLNILL